MLNVRFSDRSSPLFHNVTINSLCRSALLTIFIPTRKKKKAQKKEIVVICFMNSSHGVVFFRIQYFVQF